MAGPEGDEGGGAQARVNVLAELPLLEARLDAPSLRTTDVDQSQVRLLRFNAVQVWMHTSKISISAPRLEVACCICMACTAGKCPSDQLSGAFWLKAACDSPTHPLAAALHAVERLHCCFSICVGISCRYLLLLCVLHLCFCCLCESYCSPVFRCLQHSAATHALQIQPAPETWTSHNQYWPRPLEPVLIGITSSLCRGHAA